MKTVGLMIVLLSGAVAFADEPNSAEQPAAAAPAQATERTSQEQATAAQEQDAAEATPAGEAENVPLHRDPMLLRMLARNNQLRESRGLRPHRINPALTKAAMDHATYMARTRVFSHYANGGPNGRAVRHGFRTGVLENIGYGYGNVDNMFSGWINSSGHRASLMSNTTDVGFGYALSPSGTPYWVAVYGTAPKGEEPAVEIIELPADESTGDAAPPAEAQAAKEASEKNDAPKVADAQSDAQVVPASNVQMTTKRRHRR